MFFEGSAQPFRVAVLTPPPDIEGPPCCMRPGSDGIGQPFDPAGPRSTASGGRGRLTTGSRPRSRGRMRIALGSVRWVIVPPSGLACRVTRIAYRSASRATTARPIIRKAAMSTDGGRASRSLSAAICCSDMPSPWSSTCSST